MKKVILVRQNTKTTKILIAEDGRKLGCPFGDGTAQCGTWCALFDVLTRTDATGTKTRSWATCQENMIGEISDDSKEMADSVLDNSKRQA